MAVDGPVYGPDGRQTRPAVRHRHDRAGWHIYSITQPTSESGNPTVTKIEVKLPPGVRLSGPFKPSVAPEEDKEPDAYGDLPIETHEGTVTWYAPIELAAGVDPAKLKITGTFSFGACDANSCMPPQDLPFTAALGPGVDVPDGCRRQRCGSVERERPPRRSTCRCSSCNWPSRLSGGLILNLMPCVLPVISLKILAFVQQAGESRGRVFLLNVWYSLGLLSVFMVLAALAAGVGMAAGERLGWGEQFTDAGFKVTMTALGLRHGAEFLGRVGDSHSRLRRHRPGQRVADQGRPERGILQGRLHHDPRHAVQRTVPGAGVRLRLEAAALHGLLHLRRRRAWEWPRRIC